MKKLVNLVCAFILTFSLTGISAQTNLPKTLEQQLPKTNATRFVQPVAIHQKSTVANNKNLEAIGLMDASAITKQYLAAASNQSIVVEDNINFILLDNKTDDANQSHIRLAQTYKGIPIYGAEILLHGKGNEITHMNGAYAMELPVQQLTPSLEQSSAVNIAIESVKSITDFRNLSKTESLIMHYDKPKSTLVIYQNHTKNIGYTLAWHIQIIPNLLETWDYYVDAHSGKVLHAFNHSCAADGPKTTTVSDINSINRTINTYQVGSSYYMVDASKSMFNPGSVIPTNPMGAIWTMDAQNTAGLNFAQIVSNDNLNWSTKAVSAQYNASQVFDYFKNTHNHISLNNQGGNILSVINVTNNNGVPLDNSFWNGQMLLYGNGNTSFRALVGSLDLAAHEMTHGVIQSSANLEYDGQSGAINESMADIFGCMLDRTDWLMGEDVVKSTVFPSGALRNLQDPHNGTTQGNNGWQPNHMSEYYTGSNDNGGVHLNSGILNRAYYLLATSISSSKAEKIYYRALTFYLTRYSQFSDLRYAVFQSASDLFGGSSSTEALAVKTAFDAVGIYDFNLLASYNTELTPNVGLEKILVYDPNYFNAFRMNITKTDGSTPTTLTMSTAIHKPSISDDGKICVFTDTLGKIHRFSLDGALNEAILFPTNSYYRQVAVSKDGSKLAATTTMNDSSIHIYIFQTNSWHQFKLYNATFVQGAKAPGLIKPGSLEWDYNGENILFDASYKIGDTTSFSDIALLNVWNNMQNGLGSGKVEKLISENSSDIKLMNPSFARNSPYIITYEMYNKSNGNYRIMCHNLLTGRYGMITDNNMIGTPTYSNLDNKLLFTTYDLSIQDTAIMSVSLNESKLEASAAPTILIPHVKWGNWYTVGQRQLVNIEKKLLHFKLSTLNPPAIGIVIGDSVLVKVSETATLTNLSADFMTSPFCKTEIGTVAQVSGHNKNNFTNPVMYKITAKDNSNKTYTVITQKPTESKLITSFSFQELNPVVSGTISNDTIKVIVPPTVDVTLLKATFTASAFAKVTVNGQPQVSGITENDFFNPLIYTVTAHDSTSHNYVVIVTSNTGLNELDTYKNISVYPNPTTDVIHFDLEGKVNYVISNLSGQIVNSGQSGKQQIAVQQLPAGMYFIQFNQSEKQFIGKFIKN